MRSERPSRSVSARRGFDASKLLSSKNGRLKTVAPLTSLPSVRPSPSVSRSRGSVRMRISRPSDRPSLSVSARRGLVRVRCTSRPSPRPSASLSRSSGLVCEKERSKRSLRPSRSLSLPFAAWPAAGTTSIARTSGKAEGEEAKGGAPGVQSLCLFLIAGAWASTSRSLIGLAFRTFEWHNPRIDVCRRMFVGRSSTPSPAPGASGSRRGRRARRAGPSRDRPGTAPRRAPAAAPA